MNNVRRRKATLLLALVIYTPIRVRDRLSSVEWMMKCLDGSLNVPIFFVYRIVRSTIAPKIAAHVAHSTPYPMSERTPCHDAIPSILHVYVHAQFALDYRTDVGNNQVWLV